MSRLEMGMYEFNATSSTRLSFRNAPDTRMALKIRARSLADKRSRSVRSWRFVA